MKPYFFHPLPRAATFNLLAMHGQEFANEAHDYWLKGFVRKANTFYTNQYWNHVEEAERSFRRQYHILPLSDIEEAMSENEFLADAWDVHKRETGLHDHWSQLAQQQIKLRAIEDELITQTVVGMKQLLDDYLAYIEALANDEFLPRMAVHALDELWFNTVVSTTNGANTSLRWMPYDQYLQTDHWRRLRAGMMLIRRGRCSRPHGSYSDGAWGEEYLIHVHHLSYENRGNERYAALELLCRECHAKEHADKSNV